MKTEQSIVIMKALADPSRLAIINSLLERAQYVEEISSRHALAPSTVSFHLRKLEQAGLVSSRKEQYYVIFQANESIFATTLREIVSALPAGKELQDGRMEEYRRKVLESFFRGGRLEKLPAQHKKRLIVLEQFAARFEPERRYSEPEVTQLIAPLFDDYCTIRRLLVDESLVKRNGSEYWRDKKIGGHPATAVVPPLAERGKEMPGKTERAEIKRLYKESSQEMGIYQLRNKVNGRIYLGSSRNLEGSRNSRLFQLRMGKIVFSRELQKDLNDYGAESFEFSVLAVLDPPEANDSIEHSLAALELYWLKKLQPFGSRGYNSARSVAKKLGQLENFSGTGLG
jgi:DNA-binding HxlR family transcriptional regulator